MDTQIEVTGLLGPLVKVYKELSAEYKNLLNEGLEEYLYVQTNKHIFTTNFIYRNEKIRFLDFYYPVKVKYKRFRHDFRDLERAFEEYQNVAIIGSAGSGKSTMMKYVFLQSIKQKFKIPVLIKLRRLNSKDISLEEYIFKKLTNGKVKPNLRILNESLENGDYLFLFDGYDEIFSHSKMRLDEEIEDFCDKFSKNKFIITSRPGTGATNLPRFTPFQVQPLQIQEVRPFVRMASNHDDEFLDSIMALIENPNSKIFKSYLRNPLLLSMFLVTYNNYPQIPDRKHIFYSNVFETLFSRHDETSKGSFRREFKSGLKKMEIEKILGAFCYVTLFEGYFSFTKKKLEKYLVKIGNQLGYTFDVTDLIDDLNLSIAILIKDGHEYSFPHRSLQEYFCTIFISSCRLAQKQIIFDKYSRILEKNSRSLSYDFWDLNKEIHPHDFNNCFILKNLNSFLRITDGTSEASNLLAIFSALGIKHFLLQSDVTDSKYDLIVRFDYSIYYSVLDYVGLGKYLEVFFNSDEEHHASIERSLNLNLTRNKKKESRIDLHSVWSNQIFECFFDSNAEKGYDKFIDALINKINLITTSIDSEGQSLEDLVDLI